MKSERGLQWDSILLWPAPGYTNHSPIVTQTTNKHRYRKFGGIRRYKRFG